MRSTLIPLAVILSSIFFVSCQREVDERLTDITSGDTLKIKSILFLDTTITIGNDTSEAYNFEYDNSGRVIRTTTRTIQDSDFSVIVSGYSNFFYNGNDAYPYKIESYSDDYSFYDTSYKFYDADNYCIKDSLVQSSPFESYYSIVTYKADPSGGYIYVSKSQSFPSGLVMYDSVKYHTVFANGNLLSHVDSVYNSSHSLQRVDYYNYSYDSYKNPFPFLKNCLGNIPEYETMLSTFKNNRQHYQIYSTDVATGWTEAPQSQIVTYSYRPDGYPLTGIVSGDMSYTYFNKIIYIYY